MFVLLFVSSVLGRGKLSGLAQGVSEFYMKDDGDVRPRIRFTVINDSIDPNTSCDIYSLIDTGATSELTLPSSMIDVLKLKPTGVVRSAIGSNNVKVQKILYRPVKLVAEFSRVNNDGTERTDVRDGYVDVGIFEEPIFPTSLSTSMTTTKKRRLDDDVDIDDSRRRESLSSTTSAKAGIVATIPLMEHRPPSIPDQRVILGAAALRKLQFHVNVAGRCLEIEEEHEIYDE